MIDNSGEQHSRYRGRQCANERGDKNDEQNLDISDVDFDLRDDWNLRF
jgi:hypothetical protein